MAADPENPLIPARGVDPKQDLPAMELQVLERWRERDVFAQSLRSREGAERWVFYEGPPTANGPPGSHHVLSRVFKDVYPRYHTMRGRLVQRKGGWDCHGLPVEIAVEQRLGITTKAEIEDENVIGIERFNAECRESVFAYLQEWNRLTERIGFWIDLDDAYRTLDETYIESVWWALAEIDRRGLLYEGHKVVPYCYRCGTALSSHEVALGYKDVVDRTVYVRLPVFFPAQEQSGDLVQQPGGPVFAPAQAPDSAAPLQQGDMLLIWTTTPWTLPGNVAVAVSPTDIYARTQVGDETFVLAENRVAAVLGEGAKVLQSFPGSALVGQRYEGPIFLEGPHGATSPRDNFPIVAGDFVTTEDGTGIVHLAPAFGEDDFRVAAAVPEVHFDPTDPRTLFNPVEPDGTFDQRVRSYEGREYGGRVVKDPDVTSDLIDDLDKRGLLLKEERYEHSYPHCWRCGTPLIYYAKKSWYIRTTAVREQMLAANETVNWHPPRVKHGRFGDWLANNVDWALSRERYWGTPLPVWRCGRGHTHTIRSFAELEKLSGKTLGDHHRPYVDEVTFPCPHHDDDGTTACGESMKRVEEVIDVWFDSGAMPFAQHHHPFEHQREFEQGYPAEFICEAQDQTRGWFYSLLAVATLLEREAPYRNVVCLGLILDGDGQKMSKSKGNTVEPWQVLDSYGADAFRWYFFTSRQPWDGYRFSEEAIGEGVRLFVKQLWSTYYFYVLYARAGTQTLSQPGAPPTGPDGDLDRWALSRTAATAELVAERLDSYDVTSAGRAIGELVDELSNWYVRRSRRRFWDGETGAFETLRECLLTIAKLLAPLCPFVADEIYDNLDGTLASVHLCDFPAGDALPARDPELEEAMALARETVRLGLGARGKAKRKVRQPLREAVVVADGRERAAIERLAEVVREELNVRRVRFVAAAEELSEYEVKANYRTLGSLFGKDMPRAAEAIAALDPARVAAAVRDGDGEVGIAVGGREHTLSSEDVILTMKAPEGYSVEREGAHAVALDLALDDDLRREGHAREIVHAVQNARKTAGLQVEDRIELALAGAQDLIEAAESHRDYLTGETLAIELRLGADGIAAGPGDASAADGYREQTEVDGLELTIALRRARHAP
ncbi:MAG TPA: isoleucine--tRNA ligase [Solirubrobacteraceae bacterium]|jgi:isoleucyl-tRNA synthetase|nr:isoleucine--tRNA ligase [Solirubrobacteraceae bacterium]